MSFFRKKMWAQQIFWQILVNFSIKGRNMHSKSINFVEMTLFIATLICIQRKYSKQMGRKAFIGSELIFSDTVHQFLQVLTLSLNTECLALATVYLMGRLCCSPCTPCLTLWWKWWWPGLTISATS